VKGWVNDLSLQGRQCHAQQTYSENIPDNTGRSTRRAQATGDVPLYLLQTDALKDRVNNALWRDSPGPDMCISLLAGQLVLRRTDL
jgi:phage terminase large subunit GpA-like protein